MIKFKFRKKLQKTCKRKEKRRFWSQWEHISWKTKRNITEREIDSDIISFEITQSFENNPSTNKNDENPSERVKNNQQSGKVNEEIISPEESCEAYEWYDAKLKLESNESSIATFKRGTLKFDQTSNTDFRK